MRTVTMMSGPAIRKMKNDNARLREQNLRLRKVLESAEIFCASPKVDSPWFAKLKLTIASAKEVLS